MIQRDKKISLFIGGLSGGGAERVACNLANYLFENGFLIDILTMSDVSDAYELDDGIKRICLLHKKERVNPVRNYFIRRKRLKQYLLNNQDVSCYIVMLPITIFMLLRLKRFTRSKIIIAERCNPNSYSFIKRQMMKYSAKRCDGLIVQTREISKWYEKIKIKDKVIIPNAINRDVILPDRKSIDKKIVAVGRIEKQKNYPMLISAFAMFDKDYPDYRLEIYGRGSQEKSIRKLIEKKELTGKIKLMGYATDISERIADATCFVMTSNFEGIPNALIEAMCIGVPCIATDCDGGGAKELIHNGKNGILINKNDIKELTVSLDKIVADESFAKGLSAEAVKLRKELSYEKVYDMWSSFIMQIIEKDENV